MIRTVPSQGRSKRINRHHWMWGLMNRYPPVWGKGVPSFFASEILPDEGVSSGVGPLWGKHLSAHSRPASSRSARLRQPAPPSLVPLWAGEAASKVFPPGSPCVPLLMNPHRAAYDSSPLRGGEKGEGVLHPAPSPPRGEGPSLYFSSKRNACERSMQDEQGGRGQG